MEADRALETDLGNRGAGTETSSTVVLTFLEASGVDSSTAGVSGVIYADLEFGSLLNNWLTEAASVSKPRDVPLRVDGILGLPFVSGLTTSFLGNDTSSPSIPDSIPVASVVISVSYSPRLCIDVVLECPRVLDDVEVRRLFDDVRVRVLDPSWVNPSASDCLVEDKARVLADRRSLRPLYAGASVGSRVAIVTFDSRTRFGFRNGRAGSLTGASSAEGTAADESSRDRDLMAPEFRLRLVVRECDAIDGVREVG